MKAATSALAHQQRRDRAKYPVKQPLARYKPGTARKMPPPAPPEENT